LAYLLPGFSVQSGLRAGRKFDPHPELPSSPGENATEEEIQAFDLEVSVLLKTGLFAVGMCKSVSIDRWLV